MGKYIFWPLHSLVCTRKSHVPLKSPQHLILRNSAVVKEKLLHWLCVLFSGVTAQGDDEGGLPGSPSGDQDVDSVPGTPQSQLVSGTFVCVWHTAVTIYDTGQIIVFHQSCGPIHTLQVAFLCLSARARVRSLLQHTVLQVFGCEYSEVPWPSSRIPACANTAPSFPCSDFGTE